MGESFKVSPFTSLNYADGVLGGDYVFKGKFKSIINSLRNN